MKHQKLHVCTTETSSGIADYARDFQKIVLQREGYRLCDPREITAIDKIDCNAEYHVQFGVHQQLERQAVSRLLKAGCTSVDATLHDPPFTAFPYFAFKSPFLTRLSRGFDWYLKSFFIQRRMLERLRRIFVLSQHGKDAVLQIAPKANVITIPHIINNEHIWGNDVSLGSDLLYFGFIGPNKGLDYALQMHHQLRAKRPGIQMHVVGKPGGEAAQRYLASLQAQFNVDVVYHGYVPAAKLDEIFRNVAHVILPYAPYRHIMPTSGSVLNALRRARIIWTTPANAMTEIIRDGENGFFLSGDIRRDVERMEQLIIDPSRCSYISDQARNTALEMSRFPYHHLFGVDPDRNK